MTYQLNGESIATDDSGFLLNLDDWSTDLAPIIAEQENITLSDEHWEVINFLREYYSEYQIAPAVRILIKAVRQSLGPEKGNSVYLYELFPEGPGVQGCKIAGLPKPTGCI